MKKGITTNRNKYILGPSGSGKSFFTNHMVRQYYEQGAHVLQVDTGNSYCGLSQLIHNRTHGEDGIYFTYTNENPIAFNPFYVEDGVFDCLLYTSNKASYTSLSAALRGCVDTISFNRLFSLYRQSHLCKMCIRDSL